MYTCELQTIASTKEATRWRTYSGQWHQVIVKLPISRPDGPPSEDDPDNDGEQSYRKQDELLWGRHACDLGDVVTARIAVWTLRSKVALRYAKQRSQRRNVKLIEEVSKCPRG